MSIWFWVFAIAGVAIIFGLRFRLKRRYRDLTGDAGPQSEACHQACVDLLREAIASGDEKTLRHAMDKTIKDTLDFIPLERPYPETDLEMECKALWDQAATIVHGEPPKRSSTSDE